MGKRIFIIGAGPAGIACAIQLKRYGFEPIILEKNRIGGLLRNANSVENYPNFPSGISGVKLIQRFVRHLKKWQIRIKYEKVSNLFYDQNVFKIKTNKNIYHAHIVVIASGTVPKPLPLPLPAEVLSRVFYEVTNLKKIRNKNIAIIGAGDAAFDYALSLSKKNKIFILNRSFKPNCLPLLFARTNKCKNICYVENVKVKRITREGNKLYLYLDGKETIIVDYLIVAIGRKPNLDFISTDFKKKLRVLAKHKKIYIIGDVKNDRFRQTAIAVGDGIRAAMEISKE